MWMWICVSIATSATALSRLSMIEARLCSEMVDGDLNMYMPVLLKRGANYKSVRNVGEREPSREVHGGHGWLLCVGEDGCQIGAR